MKRQAAVAIAIIALGSELNAQTTNCISVGPSMVHCDTVGGKSTDCMAIGPTMATCNSIGGQSASTGGASTGDGGAAMGTGLVALINKINETNFRKKIGKMLADGDCDGATKYALQKGRLEVGAAIQNACAQRNLSAATPPQDLEGFVAAAAQNAKVPAEVEPGLMATRVQGIGTQLLFTFEADDPQLDVARVRRNLTNEACANQGMIELLRAGASLRAEIFDAQGAGLGAALVTKSECGIP